MLKNLEELRKEMEKQKMLENLSINSINNYMHKLYQLNDWLEDKDLTKDLAEKYILQKKEEGLKFSSLNLILVAINHYNKFNNIDTYKIELGKKQEKRVNAVCVKDFKKILEHIDKLEKKEIDKKQYRLLVMLGGIGGMRANEALLLSIDDIDSKECRINLQGNKTKRNKARTIVLNKNIVNELVELNKITKSDKIFDVQYKTLSRHFKNYSNKIKKDYTFHSLRHMCATEMIDAGYDIKRVADYLGDTVKVIMEVYSHTSIKKIGEMGETMYNLAL